MLKKLKKSQWEEHLQQFLDQFQTPPRLQLVGFHPVQLPIIISEAHVKMHSVQDYSVLSLLILRLFDAGITSPDVIQSICGLSAETVRIYIEKEKFILEHIDPETDLLTDLGRETLKANENAQDGKVQSCQYYDSVLRVHIDPLTASLIPQYLEWEQPDNFEPDPEIGDFLKPRESADVDETFRKELRNRLLGEINSRKEEYVTLDAIQNGDILNSITAFRPIRIFYRWGYLAKFEGMRSPMIVLTGKLAVDTVNAESNAAGVKTRFVSMPVALSVSDCAYLNRNGIFFDRVLQREDSCFEELIEATQGMVLTMPETAGEDLPTEPDEPEDEDFYDEAPVMAAVDAEHFDAEADDSLEADPDEEEDQEDDEVDCDLFDDDYEDDYTDDEEDDEDEDLFADDSYCTGLDFTNSAKRTDDEDLFAGDKDV